MDRLCKPQRVPVRIPKLPGSVQRQIDDVHAVAPCLNGLGSEFATDFDFSSRSQLRNAAFQFVIGFRLLP